MSRDAESIFTSARRRPLHERAAFLDGACGDDAHLRARVDALLAAEAKAGNFLRSAESDPNATISRRGPAPDAHLPAEEISQSIGRYKLLEQIGEGGFGTVWLAEQREPVKRRVALKIIKLGMDTKQVIARFEAERQALALMDHPNIAKVFDGGATDTGRPYFVMEYIRGVPILEYCDTEKLDTKARLELFISVCHALQHAHHKGIIHRDIKPSNVLITLHDGKPVPKVIDFGIAKATNTELTQKTLFTQHRQMIGTPAYMSPEQAEMSGLDIDTRSDVYSLGVLLYELLTGTTPFDAEELLNNGYAEMMRIIREQEPHKPSTRLSSLGDTATRTAEQRRSDTSKLSLLLCGDLDWIVMKCLEKDRARRYETANGLAADVRRHLKDEPVVAGPPTAGYRLQKFVKRNRGQVVAAGIVAATLLMGVSGTTGGLLWALSERDRADAAAQTATLAAQAEAAARLEAQGNEQRAIAETKRAERELARATEVKRLITDMLGSVSPYVAQNADITLLKGILDDTAARLAKGEVEDELVAAELHHVVGQVYRDLGVYDAAAVHLLIASEVTNRLLGEEDPRTMTVTNHLGMLYQNAGRYADAEAIYLRFLQIEKRMWGVEHRETLSSMNNLAATYLGQGRYAAAEALLLPRTLELMKREFGEEHHNTLQCMHNLGFLYQALGRCADAEPLQVKILEVSKRMRGEGHPETLKSMLNLAAIYILCGHYTEAEPLCEDLLKLSTSVLGPKHPQTLATVVNLGALYNRLKRFDDARRLFEPSVDVMRQKLGTGHSQTKSAISGLAVAYEGLGRRDDALPLYRELLDLQLAAAEGQNARADTINDAAWVLLTHDFEELRDPALALRLAGRACHMEEESSGANLWGHLDTLALAQHRTGDTAAALDTQRRALELMPEGADPEMAERLATYEAALAAKGETVESGNDQ
jgi:tetratricopeptide (TPR) repeat protein